MKPSHRVCRRSLWLVLVCLSPTVSAGATDAEAARRARAECAAAATRSHTVNVGTGVQTEHARVLQPLEIRIPLGIDPANFRNCLEARGLMVDVREDRFLQAIEACRGERRERVGLRIADRPGTIGGDDSFQECLSRRMGGIEVEIEAIGEPDGDAGTGRPADR
jgi:hypothetical protein